MAMYFQTNQPRNIQLPKVHSSSKGIKYKGFFREDRSISENQDNRNKVRISQLLSPLQFKELQYEDRVKLEYLIRAKEKIVEVSTIQTPDRQNKKVIIQKPDRCIFSRQLQNSDKYCKTDIIQSSDSIDSDIQFENDTPLEKNDEELDEEDQFAHQHHHLKETDQAIKSIRNKLQRDESNSYFHFIKKQDKMKDIFLNFQGKDKQDPIQFYCLHEDYFPKKLQLTQYLVDNIMNFSDLGLTSKYLPIIKNLMKSQYEKAIKQLNLSGNKLNEWAIKLLVDAFPVAIRSLDISNNDLGRAGGLVLSMHLYKFEQLKSLNLSGNFLGDAGSSSLLTNITKIQRIKKLNLSNNNLGDNLSIALYNYISSCSQIQQLILNWNKLGSICGGMIAKALIQNRSMKVLDLSYNRLGLNDSDQYVSIWYDALSHHQLTLVHLDLSFNQFGMKYLQTIKNAILKNEMLYGLHVEGNKALAYVDETGIVQIQQDLNEFKNIQQSHPKIDGVNYITQVNNDIGNDCCWICQGWMENQFVYVPEYGQDYGDMYIHLDFMGYKPKLMMTSQDLLSQIQSKNMSKTVLLDLTSGEIIHQLKHLFDPDKKITMAAITEAYDLKSVKEESDENLHNLLEELTKFYYTSFVMCPPNVKVKYFFSSQKLNRIFINELFPNQTISQDDHILQGRYKYHQIFQYGDNSVLKDQPIDKINYFQTKQMFVIDQKNKYQPLIKVIPRCLTKRILLNKMPHSNNKKKKNTFEIERSLYTQGDNQEIIDKCFKIDCDCIQFQNLIKSDYDLQQIKQIIQQFYHKLKDIYKYYSSDGYEPPQYQIFCIKSKKFINLALELQLHNNSKIIEDEIAYLKYESDQKYIYNPSKALIRYQFIQILFRLSILNCISQKQYSDSVYELFHKVDIKFKYFELLETWRNIRYQTKECSLLLQLKHYFLKQLYDHTTKITKSNWSFKLKWITVAEFLEFTKLIGVAKILPEQQLKIIYNFSMQTQVDEINQDRVIRMTFLEFLESLARLAEIISPCPAGENIDQWKLLDRQILPLHVKLEAFLTHIFRIVNIKGEYENYIQIFCTEQSDVLPKEIPLDMDSFDQLSLVNTIYYLNKWKKPYLPLNYLELMKLPQIQLAKSPLGRISILQSKSKTSIKRAKSKRDIN